MTHSPETAAAPELLPCPFCGSTEHLRVSPEGSFIGNMPDRPYRVTCGHLDCEAVAGPVQFGRHGAIAAWNRRAPALTTEAKPEPVADDFGPAIIVDYTNWRGGKARRTIRPGKLWWGQTEWHPHDQWLMTAWDCEKAAVRDFALQDMQIVPNPETSAAHPAGSQAVEGPRAADIASAEFEKWIAYLDPKAGERERIEWNMACALRDKVVAALAPQAQGWRSDMENAPRILYVCEFCAENCPENCGHYNPQDVRRQPSGEWVCQDCYDNYDHGLGEDGDPIAVPPFDQLPLPDAPDPTRIASALAPEDWKARAEKAEAALAFYADEETYADENSDYVDDPPIERDRGAIARAALGGAA